MIRYCFQGHCEAFRTVVTPARSLFSHQASPRVSLQAHALACLAAAYTSIPVASGGRRQGTLRTDTPKARKSEKESNPSFLGHLAVIWLNSCHVCSVSHPVLAGKAPMTGVVSLFPFPCCSTVCAPLGHGCVLLASCKA